MLSTDLGYAATSLSPHRTLGTACCLRVCYAMSGTDIAYGPMRLRASYAMSGTDIESHVVCGTDLAYCAISTRVLRKSPRIILSSYCPRATRLRACYAMSGTDIAYQGLGIHHDPYTEATGLRVWCCAVCGTELAYGATRPENNAAEQVGRRLLCYAYAAMRCAVLSERRGLRDVLTELACTIYGTELAYDDMRCAALSSGIRCAPELQPARAARLPPRSYAMRLRVST
eukprot:2526144-Rhodomonas_salina.1